MFPQPMSRSEFRPDDSHPDPARVLEQHLLAGFPPELALDLVLNELVVRAADATHASAAALALARGKDKDNDNDMVCRAATGDLAPDLGVPLNTRDGLSGDCFQTRRPQLSADTQLDPRVDPDISSRLGIRSILIVPVFDSNYDKDSNDDKAQLAGILEVFSSTPGAFSNSDQKLLEGFAEECVRIRRAAIELTQRQPAAAVAEEFIPPQLIPPDLVPPDSAPPDFAVTGLPPARHSPYETWTLVLGSLAILAIVAISFLIGFRIGWLRPPRTGSSSRISQPIPAETATSARGKSRVETGNLARPTGQNEATTPALRRESSSSSGRTSGRASESGSDTKSTRTSKSASNTPTEDELVVYEKGKVIFRMKPSPAKPDQASSDRKKPNLARSVPAKPTGDAVVEASSIAKITPTQAVWLAPAQAETRLLSRTEPEYPPEAVAAHRAGNVVLEVQVAEDGSVSSVRALSGDPLLAAAATAAVRNWRYQPYRRHDRPIQFQTDVTLTFALPEP